MSNLVPRLVNPLGASADAPAGFSRSESKELTRAQNAEVTRGLVAGTRLQAAGFVAQLGLSATGALSREARFQADGDPQIAARLDYIVDAYAMYVAAEVNRFQR